MRWLLRGGRVVDPQRQFDERADILIQDGRIAAVEANLEVEAPIEDISGCIVCPGFVDMHVHLREPGRDDKEDMRSGLRAAVRGGFTAVGLMPNTTPPMDSVAAVAWARQRGAELGLARVHPIPCITQGQQGERITEFGSLLEAGAVAFSDDGRCVMNARVMRRALEYASMFDVPLIGHEEDEHLSDGGCVHEGYHAEMLGLAGMPSLAEEVIVARDLLLARETGGRIHIAHVSTRGSVEMIREARRRGVAVTAEVTPHHLLLSDALLRQFDPHLHKMNPPLRTDDDRDALIEGLRDGTIDCVATDHAPHTAADKAAGFGCAAFGVIGMESAVPVLLDRLVATGRVPFLRLVDALSTAPARILRLGRGAIERGAPANFTVLDPRRAETLNAEEFESKARNCPFTGWKVVGGPCMTVIEGRVVMRDRRVIDEPGPRLGSPVLTGRVS